MRKPIYPCAHALVVLSFLGLGGCYSTVEVGDSPGDKAIAIDWVDPPCAEPGSPAGYIEGNGFGAENVTVTVGGIEAEVLAATGMDASFVVPEGIPPGEPIEVVVENPGGRIATIDWTVCDQCAPPESDQVNPFINNTSMGAQPGDVWQQEVTAGTTGQLVGVDIWWYSGSGELEIAINRGAAWQTDVPEFQATITLTKLGDWNFIDLSSATGLSFLPGEQFVIQWRNLVQLTSLGGSYPEQYLAGDLYFNGIPHTVEQYYDLAFRTYMATETSCPVGCGDCDDGNECTVDTCDNPLLQVCANTPAPDGTGCDFDGLTGVCIAGMCEEDPCPSVDCDDGNECTADVCHPVSGTCTNDSVADGMSCDFGEAAGICISGTCDPICAPPESDQVNPFINNSRIGAQLGDVWQQEVTVGTAGQLVGVDIWWYGGNGEQDFSINRGPAWQTDTPEFQAIVTLTRLGDWNFIDLSSAGLSFVPGEKFVIQLQKTFQDTEMGASYPQQYLAGDLYLNGGPHTVEQYFDLAFRTYMAPCTTP